MYLSYELAVARQHDLQRRARAYGMAAAPRRGRRIRWPRRSRAIRVGARPVHEGEAA